MDKEELQAISKLVYELTITGSKTSDLDALLERLFAILEGYPHFRIEPRGAILLLNPRGRYLQVAQFGIEPAWKTDRVWESEVFTLPVAPDSCQIRDITLAAPADAPEASLTGRALLLPLVVENRGIGYAVIFVAPDYELSASHQDVFSNLAHALSSLIQGTLSAETLLIRELELQDAQAEAINRLGVAAEYRDTQTGYHIMRMTNYAHVIAKKMGLDEARRELLFVAAPMHDVGKIGISDSILLKPGKLTPEEFEVMKKHTEIGVTILSGKDQMMVAARDIALSHHERWDGTGYPRGLKQEEIPLLARICAVADVFDALTTKRPYKEAWMVEAAREEIVAKSGRQFDPAVVSAFEAAMPEILRIRELYRDDIIDPKKQIVLPPLKPRQDVWMPWEDDLSVGIGAIDEHHRYLFDLINDLHDVVVLKRGAREVARLVKALDAYAKVHFRAEEQMMSHYGFDGLDRQVVQHHAFEGKIREFYEELHANPLAAQFDVLSYLRSWLVNHIRLEDARLRVLTQG